MRKILLALAIALVSATDGQAGALHPPQYIFHFKIVEGPQDEPDKCKVLSQPTLVTTGNRQVQFHSGGKVKLLGKDVDACGTQVKLSVAPASGGKLAVQGTIEFSELVQPASPFGVVTTGLRAHLDCQVEFNRTHKIVLRRDGGNATWLEFEVGEVPAITAVR